MTERFLFWGFVMTCEKCRAGWSVDKVVSGAVGLAKVVTGIDRADDDLTAQRLAVCAICEEIVRVLDGMPSGADVMIGDSCRACGCLLRAKTRIGAESCPLGRW